jgi:hypothetical protein
MGYFVDDEKDIIIQSIPQSPLENVNTKMWYPIDSINDIFCKSMTPITERHFHPAA